MWHWMFPVVFIVHQVIWGWNSIVLLTSPSLNRQKGCLVYTWLSMLCLYIQVCVSTGVYVCSIYTVCASNRVETCWQVLTLKAVWKFRVVQKNKRVLSRSEDVSLPVKSSGCSRVRTLSFVLRSSSQVQKNTRDLSCSLWSLGRCLGPAGGRSRRGRWTLWWRRCGRPSAPTPSLWGHPGEPRPRPPRTWWCLVVWRRCRFQKEPTQTVSFLCLNTHLVSVQPLPGAWRRRMIGRLSQQWGSCGPVPFAWWRKCTWTEPPRTSRQTSASPVIKLTSTFSLTMFLQWEILKIQMFVFSWRRVKFFDFTAPHISWSPDTNMFRWRAPGGVTWTCWCEVMAPQTGQVGVSRRYLNRFWVA